ncbi:gamma-secretase-activating protein isoform X2 [Ambystoma mexicanum]|uniref:gamma-secretase-activating protein isoform X2 n=1 Tax=Ambystoma mexicanum TaxID=8296 RepID=UPI0037E9A379
MAALLELHSTFELQRDVLPLLLLLGGGSGTEARAPPSDSDQKNPESLHVVNVERNGKILYTWKGNQRYTNIGLYDPNTKQNQLLYTYQKDVLVVSCSVNHEMTLLAFSYLDAESVPKQQRSGSKYLTLLIEIHPVNDLRVLKATESYVQVQFLYPVENNKSSPESHLLLILEDRYIEVCHISVVYKDGCRVVLANSALPPKDRAAEDIIWAQWDMLEQRLFYIIPKKKTHFLQCIQFYPNKSFTLMIDVPLDIQFPATALRLVNFGYNHYQDRASDKESLNLQVFTSKSGDLCMCYCSGQEMQKVTYSVMFFHKGYCKTFTADVSRTACVHGKDILFLNIGVYVAVHLPGHFLHLLNMQHPHLMCYNFFLTGEAAKINILHYEPGCVQSLLEAGVFDYCTGKMFTASINQSAVLGLLSNSKWDCLRLASMHCALLNFEDVTFSEAEVTQWICDSPSKCQSFDPIQEFIIASLYRKMSGKASHLHKMLPYTSVPHWNGVIPGVTCRTDLIALPTLKTKSPNGMWAKLQSDLEYMKHDSEYKLRRDWCKLISEVNTDEKRTSIYHQNIVQNIKRVLSKLETWNSEPRLVPIFLEEDYHHKELVGLIIVKLKAHLMKNLQHLRKNEIDGIVLNYVSTLLKQFLLVMETVWKKYCLGSSVFCLKERGTAQELSVFYIMGRILEAANGMRLPLPPGFYTLHTALGVRCLPLCTFLHYIDNGVLLLTETCVTRLLKDLDNSEKNEKLKFSIVARLPEALCQKAYQLWDHPVSSTYFATNYVKRLLEKRWKNELCRRYCIEHSRTSVNFLPLNYLVDMLAEVEDKALNPFEEDTVDSKFVEEIGLKQTRTTLSLYTHCYSIPK